jgi:aminopeptidase
MPSADLPVDEREYSMSFHPPEQHVERYADLLVNFALGDGAGISPGDVVQLVANESAKPLYAAVSRAVWRAGGQLINDYRPDDDATTNLSRDFYEIASDEQISFFKESYVHGVIDQADHLIYLEADADPRALSQVDPAKIIAHQSSMLPAMKWRDDKENAGRFSWTIALYGTPAMAAEANLTFEEYWDQIVAACFLDDEDPKERWRSVDAQIKLTVGALDALPIERLHVRGEDIDLRLTLGEGRRWIGGGGKNIPSFEIFTAPDWRGTEGRVRFSEPLYVHGNLITGVELEFADGVVTRASAAENEPMLTEMLSAENANRIGEFSLTDARFSRITKFMATTLYDENVGGPNGNTHLAVGKAIQACYDGDPSSLSDEDWQRLGFNDSIVHTDIVSTTDREVTATLTDGSERVIYAGGHFQLDAL